MQELQALTDDPVASAIIITFFFVLLEALFSNFTGNRTRIEESTIDATTNIKVRIIKKYLIRKRSTQHPYEKHWIEEPMSIQELRKHFAKTGRKRSSEELIDIRELTSYSEKFCYGLQFSIAAMSLQLNTFFFMQHSKIDDLGLVSVGAMAMLIQFFLTLVVVLLQNAFDSDDRRGWIQFSVNIILANFVGIAALFLALSYLWRVQNF